MSQRSGLLHLASLAGRLASGSGRGAKNNLGDYRRTKEFFGGRDGNPIKLLWPLLLSSGI